MTISVEIRVVSLSSAFARRELVHQNLDANRKLRWRFFDGVTHDAIVPGLVSIPETQTSSYGRALTNGEIGCFKSHFRLISEFLDKGETDWMLVLEDDVWFDVDFDLAETIGHIEKRRINYIRLFAKMYKPADFVAPMSGFRQIIRFRTDPYGTQAYLINKNGARSFLNGLVSINVPIDDELGRFWRHGLHAYSVFPFPAVERSVVSSLEATRNAASGSRTFFWKWFANRAAEKTRKSLANARYRFGRR